MTKDIVLNVSTLDTFFQSMQESRFVGEKIESREGIELTALLAVAPSDRPGLARRIAAAIEESPLKATGLHPVVDLLATPELLLPIKL